MPSSAELTAFYQSGYFTGQGPGYSDYFVAERRSNLKKAAHRLGVLETLGLTPGARLLDVGCADGTFVEAACQRGLDAYGIEVSAEAINRMSPSVRERVAASHDEASRWAPFQCMTFWDVLEHLPSPVEALETALQYLSPGGLVGVVVPVIDNVNARRFPRTWDQYKPPEHLWYFSRNSLRALLGRVVGDVVFEEGAWRRNSRLFEVALGSRGLAGHALAAAEGGLAVALAAVRLLPANLLEDSVAMFARQGKTPARSG